MSAQSTIYNPTQTTSAASGDGFSVPRLTTTGRTAISFGPADKGMMVYDTTLNSLFIWNGSAWELIDGTGTSSNTQVLFNDNGATAGDSTMTFNKNTDTLTVQNLVVTGTTTALGGLDASSIRAAASDYAAVNFDGVTASTRITSTLTGQNIGTGDVSLWTRFRVPSNGPRGLIALSSSPTDSAAANAFSVYPNTSGSLVARIFGASSNDFRQAAVANFLSAYVGQVVDVVVTRAGNTLKIYINGADAAYTETTNGTPPNWSDTITSSFLRVGLISSTEVFHGRIYRSVVFNRALSASDVTELITTGVNPVDQWGTQTQVVGYNPPVLNGGFETNSLNAAGTWATAVLGTSTATIDTSGLFSRTGTNAGKFTLDGSSSYASFQANNGATNLLAVNKRYRISFWARKGATSGSCGVQIGNTSSGAAYGNTGLVLTTSYTNTVVEVVTVTDGGFTLGRQGSSAAGAEIYIDDVEITRIGAIVDLNFTIGTGYQATDRSTNQLNGTLFNGVSWTMPETSARLYATTAFAGNSQMLGTLAIPTNAIIEDIIVYTTGISTVFVGNASGDNSIVGATAIAPGYNRLTLSAFRSSTGNLWVNCTQPDTLRFTIVYSIAQP